MRYQDIIFEAGLTVYGENKGNINEPSANFIRAVRAALLTHSDVRKYVDLTLTIITNVEVEITFIETERRKRNGYAGVVLNMLVSAADMFGVELQLQALADTRSSTRLGLRQNELEAFYGRRGFQVISDNNHEVYMQRLPVKDIK